MRSPVTLALLHSSVTYGERMSGENGPADARVANLVHWARVAEQRLTDIEVLSGSWSDDLCELRAALDEFDGDATARAPGDTTALTPEDRAELARLASMTDEEADEELRAVGVDPVTLRERATEFVAQVLAGRDAIAQEPSEQLYCIQDRRTCCGDAVVWWRVGGMGYTYGVDQAWVIGEEEARQIEAGRGTDRAWPVSMIEQAIVRCVDGVRLRYAGRGRTRFPDMTRAEVVAEILADAPGACQGGCDGERLEPCSGQDHRCPTCGVYIPDHLARILKAAPTTTGEGL